VQGGHLRRVGESLENPQPEGQCLLDFSALLPELELLELFDVLVELQVVQDDGDEQAEHDQRHEQVVQDEVNGDQRRERLSRSQHRLVHHLHPRFLRQDLEHRHKGLHRNVLLLMVLLIVCYKILFSHFKIDFFFFENWIC